MRIDVSVIREKSFDPIFHLKITYEDEGVVFKNAVVEVTRRPPKVTIDYPEDVKPLLPKVDIKKLELEIMNKVVAFLLGSSR